MSAVLLQFGIHGEPDVVRVRRRARELATLLGFDLQDQTRIATAASEVARNAFQYASGGKVTFSVSTEGAPEFVVHISDSGPGIANLTAVLDGRVKSRTGLGVGLLGSRKLMDALRVESVEGRGTAVELRKALPAHAPMVTPKLLAFVETEMSRASSETPFDEVRRQNQELVRVLDDLKSHQAQLARVNVALETRVDFERHLVGIVSHDLRSPLSAILMSAGLLVRRANLDEPQLRAVNRIILAGDRAERMIRDLLDFTQARIGGGIPVQRAPMNMHALAQHIVDELRTTHLERVIELEESGDGGGEWDSDRVAQVLTNLVRNAIQHSPRETPVHVESCGLGDSLVLKVHNHGTPISPETSAVLFEPMRRGRERQEGPHGVGLGLFIVKQIVGAHQGAVDFHSSQAGGTTFTVSLPRHGRPGEAGNEAGNNDASGAHPSEV
jgi:signal transduction histidine kinase